jgi:hypothetical protein
VVRRRRGLAAFAAFAWAGVGFGLLLGVSHRVPEATVNTLQSLRWLAALWSAAWLVVPVLFVFLPVWRRTRSAFDVARAVDARVPSTAGALGTAVDLTTSRDLPLREMIPARAALVTLHLEQAERAASLVHPVELLPLSLLGRMGWVGPAVLLFGAGVALWQGPATQHGLALLFAPLPPALQADSADEDAALPVTLVLKNLTLVLTPPAYSGREVLRLEGTTGDFRALPGTAVRLEGDVAIAAKSARVVWVRGAQEAASGSAADGRVRVDFVTGRRASYRVELILGAGREPLRTRAFRVETIPDDPPQLEVTGPADGREVHEGEAIDIGVRASDDFALQELSLLVERRGHLLSKKPLAEVAGLSRWEGEVSWVPSVELGQRGGRISLVIEAFDNDTVLGPKVTRSAPIKLYVPTARDHHDRVRSLKQRLLDQGLDLLAELLVGVADSQGRTRRSAAVAEFDHQNSLAVAFFKTAAELASAMERDELERRDVYLGVGLLVQNLGRRWTPLREDIERLVRRSQTLHLPSSVLARLRAHREGAISELERIVLDLSAFVDLQIGEGVSEELAELAPDLAELSSLIRRAEQGADVDSEIADALAQLAEQMRSVARAMAERSAGPDDGFANQVPAALGEDLMAEVERLLAEGKHAEALEKLREAMDALSSLQDKLAEEASDMAGSQVASELQKKLGDALADLDALESRQRTVIEETKALQQKLGGPPGLSAAERAQVQRDIERLRDHLEQLPPEQAEGMFRAQVRNWSRVADRLAFSLAEAFAAGTLGEASSLAESVGEYLGEIARTAEIAATTTPGRDIALREAGDGQRLAASIAERLRRGEEEARSGQQQAAQQSQGVRSKQTGVRQGLSGLEQRLKELGGSAYNPARGAEQLSTAGQLMQRAEARMNTGELASAQANEEDALRQLRALRQSLEDSRQAMQQSEKMGVGGTTAQRRPGAGRGVGDPWRRLEDWQGGADPEASGVEISDPEDFVSPEAFRSLIQEEAAGEAPKRYKPLNNSYYEELAR